MWHVGHTSVSSHLSTMETGSYYPTSTVKSLHGHSSFVRRFSVASQLEGHRGCVNRLALSEDATLLLSGSDDCTLRVWSVNSSSCTERAKILPGHELNIFGVAFMPSTNNEYVVSGGLDSQVRYTHVERNRSTLWKCHDDSVKTVSPLNQHTFITASRDSTVRLFDVRLPNKSTPPVIIRIASNSSPVTHYLPLNSAIPSPVCSNHILVSADDPTIRIFDLRVCLPSKHLSSSSSSPTAANSNTHYASPIESYCPPHLHHSAPEQPSRIWPHSVSATYANFSNDGRRIVASYLFDSVSVFDRFHHPHDLAGSKQQRYVSCNSPYGSRRHSITALNNLLHEMTTSIFRQQDPRTISLANRILNDVDDSNMYALVCKAYGLQRRGECSDFRTAYGTLQHLIDTLRQNRQLVTCLWSSAGRRGEVYGRDRGQTQKQIESETAELWIKVFEYMQAFCLSRILPSVSYSMRYPSRSIERKLMLKRLEYIDRISKRLQQYRSYKCPKYRSFCPEKDETWSTYINLALGNTINSKEAARCKSRIGQHEANGNGNGGLRKRFLIELIENFHVGLDRLAQTISSNMEWLQPKNNHDNDTVSNSADNNDHAPTTAPPSGNTQPTAASTNGSSRSRITNNPMPFIQINRHQFRVQMIEGIYEVRAVAENMNTRDGGTDLDSAAANSGVNVEPDEDEDEDEDEDDEVMSHDSDYHFHCPEQNYHPSLVDLLSNNTSNNKTGHRTFSADEERDILWGELKRDKAHQSFIGHLSKQTEIKEANFFGSDNQVVMSGSDDGHIFLWNADTSELINRIEADGQIVNCVLPHPHRTMVFASGIDDSIKLLAP